MVLLRDRQVGLLPQSGTVELLTFGEVFDQRAFRLPLFVMTSRGQPEAPPEARIAERNATLRRRLFRESVVPCFPGFWQSVGRESPDSTRTNCQIRRKPTTRLSLQTRSQARGRDGRVAGQEGEAGESRTQTYLTGDSSMAPPAARSRRPKPSYPKPSHPKQDGVVRQSLTRERKGRYS